MSGVDEQQKEADQVLKQSMAQAKDHSREEMKKNDGKGFAQMAWTDQSASEALKKLTQQLNNSGAPDQLNFSDDKHQQIQNLQQISQLNQQLRQMDPLGNFSQQLQQNMNPLHLQQQLTQLQQLNDHLQNQNVADSHQQDEGEYLQDQLRQLMEDQQPQNSDLQSCLNAHGLDETELQKTLKAALQQRAKHVQQGNDYSPNNDKLDDLDH